MKKMMFTLFVLGVLFVQRIAMGTVYLPYINWAVHSPNCTVNGTQCLYWVTGNVVSTVPTAPVTLNTGRYLGGTFKWSLGRIPDTLHPTKTITYKWCDKLKWSKAGGGYELFFDYGITGGVPYIEHSIPADITESFTDTHTPSYSRIMYPAGVHHLQADIGIETQYLEINDNDCSGAAHVVETYDNPSFTVQ
jgi:hypothetical protein